jgi:hypothetical protein
MAAASRAPSLLDASSASYTLRINSSLVGVSSSPGARTYTDETGECSRQVTATIAALPTMPELSP